MLRFCFISIICGLLIISSGCSRVKEATKCVAGVSTKVLEDARKDAVKKTFNYDYKSCYEKSKEILIAEEAYIYAQGIEKRMIAVYVSRQDTTPVGVFFKEAGPATTEIEISSPSKYAKEFIAKKLFTALEEVLSSKKEGSANAKQ